ncbi:uncharacterized protein ACRADG_004749 [Cochliomyia hominivorax]
MHIKTLLFITLIIAVTITTCNAVSKSRKTQRSASVTKNRSRSVSTHNSRESARVHNTGGTGNVQKTGGSSQKSTTNGGNRNRKTGIHENEHNTNANKHGAAEIGQNNKESQHHHSESTPSNIQPIYIITNEKPKKETSEIDYYAEGYLDGIEAARRQARRKTTTVAPRKISSTSTTTTISSVKNPCVNEAQIAGQDILSTQQPTQRQPNNEINCEPVSPNSLSVSSTDSSSSSPPQLGEGTPVPLAPIQEIIPYNNDY